MTTTEPTDAALLNFCVPLLNQNPSDMKEGSSPLVDLNAAVRAAMRCGLDWAVLPAECSVVRGDIDAWAEHTGTPESMAHALIVSLWRASQ